MEMDNRKGYPKEDEEECEVYLKRELVSALKDVKIERMKVEALVAKLSEVKRHAKGLNKNTEES